MQQTHIGATQTCDWLVQYVRCSQLPLSHSRHRRNNPASFRPAPLEHCQESPEISFHAVEILIISTKIVPAQKFSPQSQIVKLPPARKAETVPNEAQRTMVRNRGIFHQTHYPTTSSTRRAGLDNSSGLQGWLARELSAKLQAHAFGRLRSLWVLGCPLQAGKAIRCQRAESPTSRYPKIASNLKQESYSLPYCTNLPCASAALSQHLIPNFGTECKRRIEAALV